MVPMQCIRLERSVRFCSPIISYPESCPERLSAQLSGPFARSASSVAGVWPSFDWLEKDLPVLGARVQLGRWSVRLL